MSAACLPRLSDQDAARLAVLAPAKEGEPWPAAFVREGDAFEAILSRSGNRFRVSWPDGSAGAVVLWANEEPAARLAEVYRIARQALEDRALDALASGAVPAIQ